MLCHCDISSDINDLVTVSSFRQGKGNYPLVPDVPEPDIVVFNSHMDNPHRRERKSCERSYLCNHLKPSVIARYLVNKLPEIQVQMDIKNRNF